MTKYYSKTKLLFIALVIILTAAGCRGETEKQRIVVAHYMAGNPMYREAGEITLAIFKKDIIDAHDQGVDAFQVNLVTWNDMGEDSHWSPHPEPNRRWGIVHSHAGYAELNKYYIQWWKSGRQPSIEQDKLFYFYRNQFHDARPLEESCPHDCGYHIPDLVYVTTKLTAPARLTIHSGSKTTVYDAPAGIHYWEADMGVGTQRFTLVRDGKTVIDKTGEKTVDETPRYKSWSLFSGYAIGISE